MSALIASVVRKPAQSVAIAAFPEVVAGATDSVIAIITDVLVAGEGFVV